MCRVRVQQIAYKMSLALLSRCYVRHYCLTNSLMYIATQLNRDVFDIFPLLVPGTDPRSALAIGEARRAGFVCAGFWCISGLTQQWLYSNGMVHEHSLFWLLANPGSDASFGTVLDEDMCISCILLTARQP